MDAEGYDSTWPATEVLYEAFLIVAGKALNGVLPGRMVVVHR